jgi:hypothetical protein
MLSIRMQICLHAWLFVSLPAHSRLSLLTCLYLPRCCMPVLSLCACLLNYPVCYHLGYELLVDQVEDGCLHLPVPACSLCACLLNCVIFAACLSARFLAFYKNATLFACLLLLCPLSYFCIHASLHLPVPACFPVPAC